MNNNILNNQTEKELAREALEISLKNGARQARVTLNIGTQNAFAVLDGKLDRLHMANDRSLYIQLYTEGRYGVFSTNRMERGELEYFIKQSKRSENTAMTAFFTCCELLTFSFIPP